MSPSHFTKFLWDVDGQRIAPTIKTKNLQWHHLFQSTFANMRIQGPCWLGSLRSSTTSPTCKDWILQYRFSLDEIGKHLEILSFLIDHPPNSGGQRTVENPPEWFKSSTFFHSKTASNLVTAVLLSGPSVRVVSLTTSNKPR